MQTYSIILILRIIYQKENLLFIKFNLTDDDELVIKYDTLRDLRNRNTTFYAYVLMIRNKRLFLFIKIFQEK